MISTSITAIGVIVGAVLGGAAIVALRNSVFGRYKCPKCGIDQWLIRSRASNARLSYVGDVNDMSEWEYRCKAGCCMYLLWRDSEGYSLTCKPTIDIFKEETVKGFLNGVLEWDPEYSILVRIVGGNSLGYHVFTNDDTEVRKWLDNKAGYCITRKSEFIEVRGRQGIMLTFPWIQEIAQQVDSAEASTIAVPPSEPSGSPR